jgi:hypothetical protein
VLDYKLQTAGGDIQKFLQSALEGQELGAESAAAVDEIYKSLESVEQEHGHLDGSNEKGWEALGAKIGVCARCLICGSFCLVSSAGQL